MNLKKSLSKYTLQDWIFLVFSTIWICIVVLDYLNKQMIYIPSVTHFKYINLMIFLSVLGSFLSLYYNRVTFFKRWPTMRINGIIIFVLMMMTVMAITLAYNKYWKAPLDYTNYLHLIGKGLFTIGGTLILVTAVYAIGALVRSKLLPLKSQDLTIVLWDICLGFCVYTVALFFLGLIGVLDQIVVLGLLILMILIGYKQSFSFVKKVLWDPIKRPSDLNFIGGLISFFIVVYISMNYLYTQAPYPLGFDARNYYVNIPKLIGESGELVAGFQPYAWGLVMSTGYVAFKSPEITMFISALGGILSLFGIYHLCHKYFRISSNLSFLVVLLYLLTPTVTNHFIIEFKVDLALLFFQVATLNFLMWWIYKSNKDRKSLLDSRQDFNIICLLGIILGYSLSIKALSIFLIFGIFMSIWWYHKDVLGVLGIAASGIGIILVSGLDNLSGLREYHLSPSYTGYALVVIGIITLALSFKNNSAQFIKSTKIISICSFVCLLTFSPWIYKNYTFTKSTSIVKLIMGDKPRPDVKLRRSR